MKGTTKQWCKDTSYQVENWAMRSTNKRLFEQRSNEVYSLAMSWTNKNDWDKWATKLTIK